MKFCDVQDKIESKIDIIRDCNFEHGYLVGKPYDKSSKLISYIGNPKYVDDFLEYDIAGVVCTSEVVGLLNNYSGGIAVADNPKTTFFEIHNYIASHCCEVFDSIIDSSAIINEHAIVANKNVIIGANTVICANVVVKEGTIIGEDCVIREGCVLGTPAFYYYGLGTNRKLVESTGTLRIENNVELHPNTVAEKSVLFGETIIGENTKIDNLSLIGHDSHIGANCTIAAMTTFAGGVGLGDETFVGVGVTVAPYVNVGAGAKLSSGAVATADVPEGMHVSGNFAIEHSKYITQIKKWIEK